MNSGDSPPSRSSAEGAAFTRPGSSLGSAVKWAYLMNWAEQGVSALVLFFMAGILGPRVFGIVTMAMIFISLLEIFLDQGFSTALIQRSELREGHANVAFWIILATSIVFFALAVSLADPWARLNQTPEVALVLQVLALRLPVNAASRVQNALIMRRMEYRTVALRNSAAVIMGGGAGITAALLGLGIWALVIQQLVKEVAGTFMIWRLSDWRPGWVVGRDYVRDLWGFSRANVMARLGVFAGQQGDAMLVGFFLGPTAVGIYRLATRVVGLGMQLGAQSLQTVSLPALARSQDDPAAMHRVARKLLSTSFAATLPMFSLLAAMSPAIMSALGKDWASGSLVLAVLSIAGVFGAFSQFTVPILQATSAPGLAARIIWVQSVTSLLIFAAVAEFFEGANEASQLLALASAKVVWGACLALGAAGLFALPRVGLQLKDLVKLASPAFGAAVAGVCVSAFSSFLLSTHFPDMPLIRLMLEALPAAMVAGVVLYFLEPAAKDLFKKLRGSSNKTVDSAHPEDR